MKEDDEAHAHDTNEETKRRIMSVCAGHPQLCHEAVLAPSVAAPALLVIYTGRSTD